jgi:hypothetical protein
MILVGGCLCGAVRYQVDGKPFRIGLCHCADCRKESGSSFSSFAHWPRDTFTYSGEISTYAGRSFCPRCGGRLFCLNDNDVEIRFGSLDKAPTDLVPEMEVWTKRREKWLPVIQSTKRFDEDPT